jgi:HPt (histidine-containing phosphotransfer) domain-containing protein
MEKQIENEEKIPLIKEITVFDYQDLKERLMLDNTIMKKFIDKFFNGIEDKLEPLKIAITSRNYEEIVSNAHNLKGVSINLSFIKFSQLMGAIELAAKEKKINNILTDFKKIKQTLIDSEYQYINHFN